MAASIADRALRSIGAPVGVRRLSAGRSSDAWVGTVDGQDYVVRVPVGDGLRPIPDYAAESRLLDDLAARGAPVAVTRLVSIDERHCSVARRLPGRPIEPDRWTDGVVSALARFLVILHATDPALAVEPDIVRRFHLASVWPFDGSDLADHAVVRVRPDRVAAIAAQRDAIETAAVASPLTVVHTDLHPQHLLIADDGSLEGVLDFGDSFPGVAAWDHACLRYYHGAAVQQRVATALGPAAPASDHVDAIGVAWALYKLAKTPDRPDVIDRVDRMLPRR